MPSEWTDAKIGDLGRIVTGKTPPSSKPQCFGRDYPFITPSDMKGQKNVLQTGRYLSEEGALLLKRNMIPPRSVAVSCIGWQMGKAIMTCQPSFTNQQLNSIIPNDRVEPAFLYYSLSTRQRELLSLGSATGVRTPILNKSTFSDLTVAVPPLKTQRKIASILSTYDDLIENNTRRIKILEEMAQTLYREWLVNFRFPGHEQVKMVDSPLGKIPEGWEVKTVGDLLCKVIRRKKVQKKDYFIAGEIPVIDQGREFIGGYTDYEEALIEDQLPRIVFGDHTRILKYVDFPFACGADGTQLMMSNTPQMPPALFYYALLEIDLSNFGYARHFKFLKAEEIVVPDQKTASLYQQYVKSMRDQIRCLNTKNRNLRHTRDLLLPKLIVGSVDVSDLKIETKEAAVCM